MDLLVGAEHEYFVVLPRSAKFFSGEDISQNTGKIVHVNRIFSQLFQIIVVFLREDYKRDFVFVPKGRVKAVKTLPCVGDPFTVIGEVDHQQIVIFELFIDFREDMVGIVDGVVVLLDGIVAGEWDDFFVVPIGVALMGAHEMDEYGFFPVRKRNLVDLFQKNGIQGCGSMEFEIGKMIFVGLFGQRGAHGVVFAGHTLVGDPVGFVTGAF